jgi:non-specific serine/threonine protein kinase
MLSITLLNRYRLVSELGKGGMGTVYRAHDTLLDREVAIKMLTEARHGQGGQARLLNEARAAARLNHPNIVSIYDVAEVGETSSMPGETPETPWRVAGTPFIVMELVHGMTLNQFGDHSLPGKLAVARQICAALEHAHEHGIIHRDLKPENVVITADRVVKLMDFGLARQLSSHDVEPLFIGTVLYLAPEQARGQAVDARADLYALGVLLYEAFTGQLPFPGDDPLAVISQHLSALPEPPRNLRSDLPEELEAIILRLLAKDPNARFASAREVKAALNAIPTNGQIAPSRPNNLPAELTSFIGRNKELNDVRRLLAGTRLLTLTGSGGTGKTRLALRLVHGMPGEFIDGIWLVDLAPVSDPDLVAQTVAGVMGVRDRVGQALNQSIADSLHHKNLLLILDNCEHLVDVVAEFGDGLLRACPDLKLLVTSREPLGISGETTYRVPSLSLPPGNAPTPVRSAEQYEAVRLFVDRAATTQPGFVLNDANVEAVVQICRRLDGVPLALELAAARVQALGVDQIAARLDDRFRLLTGGSRTALPRQQTLRALIDWSWGLLSAEEKLLLRRLSVFVGGWTLDAAEYVCDKTASEKGELPLSQTDVLELLTHLVNKSLVMVEEHANTKRYRLLETIRQYAREKLLEAGEVEVKQVRGRQLEYFLKLAETAEPALRGGDQLVWMKRMESEEDNLRAALKWVSDAASPIRSAETWLRLGSALSRYWYLRGYWNEGRSALQLALSDPMPENASIDYQRARARALAGLGWLMDENGEDIPLYAESLAIARAIDYRWGIAFALRGLGAVLLNQSKVDQAQRSLDEALVLFRTLADPWGVGLVLYSLGWLNFFESGLTQSTSIWNEGLNAFRKSGDRWGIAVTLGALSYVARREGDYPRAVALSEESLGLYRELGDKAGIATSLSRLGNVAFRRGDYRQAISLIEEGLPLQRELGELSGLSNSFALLGLIAVYQGEHDRAKAWLEQSQDLAAVSGDSATKAYVLSYLALNSYYRGDLDKAVEQWQASLDKNRENSDRLGSGYALYGLGLVAWRLRALLKAKAQLEESLEHFKDAGDKRLIAYAGLSLCRLAHTNGDRVLARQQGSQALCVFRDLGDRQGLAETFEGLAPALENQVHAVRLFSAAKLLREHLDAPLPVIEQCDYEYSLAELHRVLGEEVFNTAWKEGQAMPLEQVISETLRLMSTSCA